MSVKKFHPDVRMIIVDGSSPRNKCFKYVRRLANENTEVYQVGYNIGHGDGMHYALQRCKTKTALIFDSDTVMLKSPVGEMMRLMTDDVYGVGWIHYIGEDGYDYGDPTRVHTKKVPYLHPYFMLLNVGQYFRFHRFVHHGAPCYKAMVDIYNKGKSDMLINCDILTGHTSGEGINWKGKFNPYIQHDFGGTRVANRKRGEKEISLNWI